MTVLDEGQGSLRPGLSICERCNKELRFGPPHRPLDKAERASIRQPDERLSIVPPTCTRMTEELRVEIDTPPRGIPFRAQMGFEDRRQVRAQFWVKPGRLLLMETNEQKKIDGASRSAT